MQITALGILSALAFILTFIFWLVPIPAFMPAAPFLNYEPKDVIMAIAGFLFGPYAVISMSVVVSLLEMPLSGTGPIGVVMNVLSTCAFACTASIIYKRWRTLAGAVVGLAAGVLLLAVVMILWNYFLTPIYTGWPRETVAGLLMPVFLPFNLIKGSINAALTVMLYKSVKTALDKSKLLPVADVPSAKSSKVNLGALIISFLVIATCVLFILSFRGVI